jgi:predicted nucleic acid-binding protein
VKEIGINIVLIDKRYARAFASSMLLNPIGVVEILERVKKTCKISQVGSLSWISYVKINIEFLIKYMSSFNKIKSRIICSVLL